MVDRLIGSFVKKLTGESNWIELPDSDILYGILEDTKKYLTEVLYKDAVCYSFFFLLITKQPGSVCELSSWVEIRAIG